VLKKLTVSNFQSHQKSELKFHPNVNVILGSSDVGKTALIRSLRWVFFNRPSGEAFRSTWGGETSVIATLDKHVITRVRDTKTNLYLLNDTKFEAMKTDVPDEIKQVLNVSEINLQRQFDRPFLLDSSPGEVAQFFNAIAHIDMIDESNKNIQSWIRDLNQKIQNETDNIKAREEQLRQFEDLDDLDKQTTALERLDKRKRSLDSQNTKLESILSNIDNIDTEMIQYTKLIKYSGQVDTILNLYKTRVKNIFDRDLLINKVNHLNQLDTDLVKQKTLIKYSPQVNTLLDLYEDQRKAAENKTTLLAKIRQLKQLESKLTEQKTIVNQEGVVKSVLQLISRKNKLQDEKQTLNKLCNNINTTSEKIEIAAKEMNTAQTRFDKAMPKRCPFCGKER
jgi:DNA repair exonuclease SbcCD ATPase subunit